MFTGWWLSHPLRKIMEFVSWDDDIPNWMESHNPFMFQTTNQFKIIELNQSSGIIFYKSGP